MGAERTAMISWGLSEKELLSYYVFYDRFLVKSGHMPITKRPESAFRSLKAVFNRYQVEKVIVENNADLSRLKDYSDGFGSSEGSRWEKKLRGIDIIMGMILDGKLGISYEIKSLSGGLVPACKFGKFIKLSQEGEAIFEKLSIRVPQRLLRFASEIYETVICTGLMVIARLDKEGRASVRIGGSDLTVLSPVDDAKYAAVWLREKGGSFEAIVSFGSSRQEAISAHRRYVISEMIKWINENGAIGLLFGTARMQVEDAARLAERLRDKHQVQNTLA